MDYLLPEISISPPPQEEPVVEPYSPFSSISSSPKCDEDTFRPVHLTPPPSIPTFHRQPLSPLRPLETMASSLEGLERERFEALLKASRERNSLHGGRKAVDLRKEITLKAHKTKHDERRARFLSKVLVSPSSDATLTPKTPPDSPAILHYSVPSPGLVSPLSFFESLNEDATSPFSCGIEPWIERVDFSSMKLTDSIKSPPPCPTGTVFPSLDQISARLSCQAHGRPRTESRPTRLPAFLTEQQTAARQGLSDDEVPSLAEDFQSNTPETWQSSVQGQPGRAPPLLSPPPLPSSSILIPETSRERRALDMLSTIKRRTQLTSCALEVIDTDIAGQHKVKWKRHSAPGDMMPLRQRVDFIHSVLAIPGGF